MVRASGAKAAKHSHKRAINSEISTPAAARVLDPTWITVAEVAEIMGYPWDKCNRYVWRHRSLGHVRVQRARSPRPPLYAKEDIEVIAIHYQPRSSVKYRFQEQVAALTATVGPDAVDEVALANAAAAAMAPRMRTRAVGARQGVPNQVGLEVPAVNLEVHRQLTTTAAATREAVSRKLLELLGVPRPEEVAQLEIDYVAKKVHVVRRVCESYDLGDGR